MRIETLPPRSDRQPPTRRIEYAQRYAELGFAVFPLHWITAARGCSCDDADCRSPGKHPLPIKGVKEASRDPLVIEAWWQRWPEANIGMAMGQVSGVFAVDVDPRNGGDISIEELQAKNGRLPDTINAMTGGGGQHLLFRFEPGRALPGKLGRGIDIKGEGGYIVVEPSVHASGVAYAWEADGDPIYGATAAPAPAWLFAADTVSSATATSGNAATAVGYIAPDRVLSLRSALAYLDADDRDTWVRVGMALRETGATNAFGIWTEWSQLSDKFDPAAQRKAWGGFKPDGRLHLESVFTWAAERGWVNPAGLQATRFSESVQRAIDAAAAPQERIEVVSTIEHRYEAFPVRLLQDTQQWIERQSPVGHPLIAQQAVLSLIGVTAGRLYVSDDGDPCHLYLGVVSDTIDYSRYAGDAVKRILSEAGLRRMIRGTRLGSAAAIYSTILKSPSSIYVSDEWGHLIAFARRQPSGAIDQAMNMLTSLYAMPAMHIDNPAEAGLKPGALDDQMVVYHPALTLLALMSGDQLAPMMRRGELGKGSLGQMLAVMVEQDEVVERKPDAGSVPKWLVDHVNAVRRLPARQGGDWSTQEIFGSSPGLRPQMVRVRARVDLEEAFSSLDSIGRDHGARSFVLGAKRTARRIAVGMAAWADPSMPEITTDIAAWAASYTHRHASAWLDRFSTLSSDEGRVSVMQQVLEIIGRAKAAGIAKRDLLSGCWAFRNLTREKREELIGTLLADEAVYQIDTKTGRGKLIVAARYARKSTGTAEGSQQFISSSSDGNAMNTNGFSSKC